MKFICVMDGKFTGNEERLAEKRWTRLYIKPRKTLGQHLLREPRYLLPLVEHAQITESDLVIELGAGSGTVTRFILSKGPAKLIAIEKDYRFAMNLNEKFQEYILEGKLEVSCSDIRSLNIENIALQYGKKVKVIGNIPFYLTGLILRKLILYAEWIELGVLTMQHEVALKLSAKPGSDIYSFITVGVNTFFQVELKEFIHRKRFIPPPKVHSQIVKLTARTPVLWDKRTRDKYMAFLRHCFAGRKRKLCNSLSKLCQIDKLPVKLRALTQERVYKLPPEVFTEVFRICYLKETG